MSEYIGSRISLISKSDIKYVGTLHEINSDSHTVALESVTSFGTQGRKGNPSEEIPGSDQVYEYIVFRGSDVKELTIIAAPGADKENNAPPQMPDDPAILGSARPSNQPPHLPPQQQPQFNPSQNSYPHPPPPSQFGGYPGPPPPNAFPNQSRFQGPGGPHGFPGAPGAVPGYGMGFPPPPPGYYGPPPGQGFPQHPPPPNFPPQHQGPFGPPGHPMEAQRAAPQAPPTGSKQGTPQPLGKTAPPASEATTSAPAEKLEQTVPKAATPVSSTNQAPPSASATEKTTAPSAPLAPGTQPPTGPKAWSKPNNRVALPLQPGNRAVKPAARPADGSKAPATGQPTSIADATQAATAAVAAAMAKLGSGAQTHTQSPDNLAQAVGRMGLQDSQRGRNRGRGGPPRGARRESAPKQIDVPKEDFDFESSNAKFNKEDLLKEAIASGSPIASPVDGQSANLATSTNGNVNGSSTAVDDVVIPPKPTTTEKGYDKKSSFFDNISSDLKDRMEQAERDAGNIDGRALRRDERNKNVETFGQGSVDSSGYRGGYRGRGRGGRGFGQSAHHGGSGHRGGRGGYAPRTAGYRGRGGPGTETAFA